MTIGDLNQKFRQSQTYSWDMLIRDLLDLTRELEDALGAAENPVTWTPALRFNNASVGLTTSVARGTYARVGKVITFTGEINLSAKGTSVGTARIHNLPFVHTADRPAVVPIGFYSSANWTPGTVPALLGTGNDDGTALILREMGASGFALATDAQFTNTTRLIFGGSYITA